MIRQLTLRNWRNYEDITVRLGAGTTFVVASNGVGKTSLVEAARWALFGTIGSGGEGIIRAGTDYARAVVELELPDLRILTVERTLMAKSAGKSSPSPVVRLNGALLPDKELDRHLMNAYGTDAGFLASLTMPALDRDHDKPTALGLEGHLGTYYGIDGLKSAVSQLRDMRKTNEARIKRIKEVNSASSRRLAQLPTDVNHAALEVEKATAEYAAVQARIARERDQARLAVILQRWQEEHLAWAEAVERLCARISVELHRPVAIDNVETLLDERLADLDQQIESIRVELALKAAREAALRANEDRLDAAHDDCPVCRRPLDDTTIALAHEANRHELSIMRASTLQQKRVEVDLLAQRDRIKSVQGEWLHIQEPGPRPEIHPTNEDEPVDPDQLAAMAEASLAALVDARAVHAQATRELDEAHAADEAMRELESLFGQQASLRVAAEATESTLTELLDKTIRPLAIEVDQRWKALFPSRGDLNTYSDGNITRTVSEQTLPYSSFSTGESMGATMLLRLLVAQMTTTADFCWFDEPLEHLDPDVRRQVANLLSRVTSGAGPLRQIVVTTYEEPLARHLVARDEERVRLVDVRQAAKERHANGG
jgi:DNA repair exonuclease SbcCD ATPase subunit